MAELTRLGAAELARGYRRGDFSPVEVTRAALGVIAARDAELNAFVLVDPEGALQAATASEARWRSGAQRGPADGVPVTVKDLLLTRGWPTLRGSRLVDGAGPWLEDSPSVARLREGGAVLIGKTTTPEFGWKGVTDSAGFGVTRNPWDPSLTPGGSSGGSAVAVAAGMCAWSVGTDGGGSVRVPAAFTGTVGFKPTGGLIPMYPAGSNGPLSHRGPMARSVADVAGLLDVIARPDPRDPTAHPAPTRSFTGSIGDGVAGMTIAYSRDLGYGRNDPAVESVVDTAVEVLRDLGARVEEADPGFTDPVAAFQTIWCAGVAKIFDRHPGADHSLADPGLREFRERGRATTASEYLDALAVCTDLGIRMARFHERYDALVTPTTPIPPFAAGRDCPEGWPSPLWASWTPYTYPFNMTRQPALSVPCGVTGDGLPVGLQIVTARHEDARALQVGRAYERCTRWADGTPVRSTPNEPEGRAQ
ncbi:amidase [Spongiactinospora sp. TRM90649]|uniref:amidase n=1 Tax=Spongiactinospora sp. TRM90649 TaxID=3031114 RepID=UPI0023F698E1|nr:amidase [Spongiactinospora sp. TRM90649]MDF5754320.1 amidase [Spongiactinospora sp. TRM90649]